MGNMTDFPGKQNKHHVTIVIIIKFSNNTVVPIMLLGNIIEAPVTISTDNRNISVVDVSAKITFSLT